MDKEKMESRQFDELDDLLGDFLALLQGIDYGEIRYLSHKIWRLRVKNKHCIECREKFERGIALKIYMDGGWGFVSLPWDRNLQRHGPVLIRKLMNQARAERILARTAPKPWKPSSTRNELWNSKVEINPWTKPIPRQIKGLLDFEHMARSIPHLGDIEGEWVVKTCMERRVNTDGLDIFQSSTTGALSHRIWNTQRKISRSKGPILARGGWELVENAYARQWARTMAQEVRALEKAPWIPVRGALLLAPEIVAVLVHETLGHGLEWDEVEKGKMPWHMQNWKDWRLSDYPLSLWTSGIESGFWGGFGEKWDADGIEILPTPLVENGKIKSLIWDQRGALKWGATSTGGLRRARVHQRPMVRMPHLKLQSGSTNHQALLKEANYWIGGIKSWHFSHGIVRIEPEWGRKIHAGERGSFVNPMPLQWEVQNLWFQLKALGDVHTGQWVGLHCHKGGQPLWINHWVPEALVFVR